MIEWIKANKLAALGGISIILASAYFFFEPASEESNVLDQEEEWVMNEDKTNTNTEDAAEEGVVIVDVKGAVNKPGVYEAEAEDRVIDVVNKAGGLKESADETKINFAIRVEDEMVIYVPEIGEEVGQELESGTTAMGGADQKDGRVNINIAGEAEPLEKEEIICQRCFRLKHYNEVQDVHLTDDDFLKILNEITAACIKSIHTCPIPHVFMFLGGSFKPAFISINLYSLM